MNIQEVLICDKFQEIVTNLKSNKLQLFQPGDIQIHRLKEHLKERQFVLYGSNCTLQSESELAEWLLSLFDNQDEILKYICSRDKFNNSLGDKDIGEYPQGEEPDLDDKPVVLEVMGYSEAVIVDFIIELDMLKNNPEQLEDYYKRLRIPAAKKFATKIKRMYNSTFPN